MVSAAYINKKGAQRPVGANAENGVHPRYVRNVTTDTPVNSITEKNADVKAGNPSAANVHISGKDAGTRATRDLLDAFGHAFDVDVDYVKSIDDGSWGRMETALRRMTVSAESANPLSTAIHEQVHLMKAVAPEAYGALEKYTMWALDEEGADVDSMIERQIAAHGDEAGFGYDEAVEELVCDATENIQNADDFEGRFAQFLSEEGYTHSEAKAVVEKIAEFFRKIRDALKSVLDSLRARHGDNVTVTEAGTALSANIDVANKQLEMFLAISKMMKQRYAEIRAGMADMPEGVVKRMAAVSFSKKSDNSNERKFIINKIVENTELLDKKSVFSVDTEDYRRYAKKSEYVKEIFKAQGNIAYNPKIGEIVLGNSGAKSTIMHGYGQAKLDAVKAIKDVLEKGSPILFEKNYEGNEIDRWLVAGRGEISGSPAYLGIIVRSYPSRGGENKFYLHEAIIIEADSTIMTGSQLSEDTVAESTSTVIVPQNDPGVNRKSQKAPDSAEVERLKAQVAKRDGRISQQSEVIDKLKTVVERGGAGTVPCLTVKHFCSYSKNRQRRISSAEIN